MTPRTLLLSVLLTLGAGVALPRLADGRAQAAELELADRYLAAYAQLDLEALRPFWDERTVWSDPTTAEIGSAAKPARGPDAIAALLNASVAGVENLAFTFEERFHSGGFVVAIGTLRYRLPAAALGRTQGDADFAMRVVSVLRLDGDTIVQHTDYTDFSRWRETIERSQPR